MTLTVQKKRQNLSVAFSYIFAPLNNDLADLLPQGKGLCYRQKRGKSVE
jgi:hypothetical protein